MALHGRNGNPGHPADRDNSLQIPGTLHELLRGDRSGGRQTARCTTLIVQFKSLAVIHFYGSSQGSFSNA